MDTIEFVSLLALLQTPEIFDGQIVRVIGLCSFGFETNALWVSVEAYNHSQTREAIWLALPEGMNLTEMHGKTMLIEGTFSATEKGHLGMFAGTLDKITRIEVWGG